MIYTNSTAQKYLALNSSKKHLKKKKNMHMRAIFPNPHKKTFFKS